MVICISETALQYRYLSVITALGQHYSTLASTNIVLSEGWEGGHLYEGGSSAIQISQLLNSTILVTGEYKYCLTRGVGEWSFV